MATHREHDDANGINWIRRLEGLVRTPIIDPALRRVFVATFQEKLRSYKVGAYDLASGIPAWETSVEGGGYGAPALTDTSVLVPSRFTGIVSIDKLTGTKQWRHDGHGRVRSTPTVMRDRIYYSSGLDLFSLTECGSEDWRAHHDEAFFYGTPTIKGKVIYTLGCTQGVTGHSERKLFAFDTRTGTFDDLEIAPGNVVSSDSAGMLVIDDLAIVGGKNFIAAIDLKSKQTTWNVEINGDACRHRCAQVGGKVFYSTLSGCVGSIDIRTGALLWERCYNEPVLTPVSVMDQRSIAFCVDGYLYQLSAADGLLICMIPIGHVPYSALVTAEGCAVIGGGEPPYAGFLTPLKMKSGKLIDPGGRPIIQTASTGTENLDVVFDIPDYVDPDSIALYTEAVSLKKEITPVRTEGGKAHFRIAVDPQCIAGDYALAPTFAEANGRRGFNIVFARLEQAMPLPNQVLLSSIERIEQEHDDYSGAAVYQMIENYYGYPHISQVERRRMVDWIRAQAGYQPFDTWRIILRRAATGAATRLEELPEFRTWQNEGRPEK